MVQGNMELKCGGCSRKLKKGIQCLECETWFHSKCAKGDLEECLKESWRCMLCASLSCDCEQKDREIADLKAELEKAKQKIKSLTDEIEGLKSIRKEKTELNNQNFSPKKTSRKTRVMGDSMIRYAGDHCRRNGVDVECFPGIRAEEMEEQIDRLGDNRKEDIVLFHVGSNDIKRAKTDDHVMGLIWDLGTAAKKKFKKAKIIISGVIKRKDVSSRRIDYINECLDWVCASQGLQFVNSNAWISEEDIGRDGIHLNRRGSEKFGRLLMDVINSAGSEGGQDCKEDNGGKPKEDISGEVRRGGKQQRKENIADEGKGLKLLQ
ncbi:hypothetical protein J437_LFUL003323, partial [Ladona fulva]